MLHIISLILLGIILFKALKKYNLSKEYQGELISDAFQLQGVVDEKRFWDVMHKSYSRDYNLQIANLHSLLSSWSQEEVTIFQNTFDLLMSQSYDANLWQKAYAINLGCSDDCFEYFRTWVIAQGKSKFYHSLREPDYLKYFARKEMLQSYEGIYYVTQYISEEKGFVINKSTKLPPYELKGSTNIEGITISDLGLFLITWLN